MMAANAVRVDAPSNTLPLTRSKRARAGSGERRRSQHRRRWRPGERALREALARDLHDRVAGVLSIMLLDLGEYETEKGASTETKRRFEELEWLAREAMRGIRETVYDLQEVEGQTASLVPQLRTHLAHTAHRAHGLALELQVGRNWPTSLPNDLARAVFAIVTQAVSNVRLHSGAHRAVVRLSFEPPDVIAEIQDDGVGLGSFGRTVEGGVGLRSMRQRARAAGGSFSIRRRPRGGTVIRAQLPLRPPE